MLELVKVALRVTSSAYDAELNQLIAAALADLGLVDIMPDLLTASEADVLIKQAVMTYCAMHFGTPANYERLKASYDEQKAQLLMSAAYTEY